jgi:hypothetical protein
VDRTDLSGSTGEIDGGLLGYHIIIAREVGTGAGQIVPSTNRAGCACEPLLKGGKEVAFYPKFGDGEKHSLCNSKEELSKWSGAKKSPMIDNLRIPTFETLWQTPLEAFLESACKISQIYIFLNCKTLRTRMSIFSGRCHKLSWKSGGPSRSRRNLRTPYPGKASSNPLDNLNPGLGVQGSSIRIRRVLAYELRPNTRLENSTIDVPCK